MHSYLKKLEKVIQNKYSKQVELLIKVGAEINVIQDIIRIEEINETKFFSSQINEMIKTLVRLTKKKKKSRQKSSISRMKKKKKKE